MPPDPPKKLGCCASSISRCARASLRSVALCFKSFSKVALSKISLPRPALNRYAIPNAIPYQKKSSGKKVKKIRVRKKSQVIKKNCGKKVK